MTTISEFIRLAEDLKRIAPAFENAPAYELPPSTLPPGCPLALTIKEASALTGIGSTNLRALSRRPDFPCVRIGSRVVIPTAALVKWLDEHIGTTVPTDTEEE